MEQIVGDIITGVTVNLPHEGCQTIRLRQQFDTEGETTQYESGRRHTKKTSFFNVTPEVPSPQPWIYILAELISMLH